MGGLEGSVWSDGRNFSVLAGMAGGTLTHVPENLAWSVLLPRASLLRHPLARRTPPKRRQVSCH